MNIGPIHVEDVLRLVGEIGQLRHTRLHAVGHLVLRNARLNLRIGDVLVVFPVERRDIVDKALFHVPAQPLRIGEEKHRIALTAKFYALVFARDKPAAPVVVVEELTAGIFPVPR